MGLLSCDMKWEEESRLQQTAREWRAFYVAICSELNDGPREILQGRPDLAPYNKHPVDGAALVQEFHSARIRGSNIFDLEIRYSTDVDGALNPLAAPPVSTITSSLRAIAAPFDADGNAVVNTAGDFFADPPTTTELVDLVIKTNVNVPLLLPSWITTHPGTVNNDTVRCRGRSFGPGTLLFGALDIGAEQNVPSAGATISTLRSTPYTTIGFELWFHADGWSTYLPNLGFFEIVPNTFNVNQNTQLQLPKNLTFRQLAQVLKKQPAYTRRRITVGLTDDYPPTPVPLDANGRAIKNPTPDQIVTLQYDFKTKQSFTGLPVQK